MWFSSCFLLIWLLSFLCLYVYSFYQIYKIYITISVYVILPMFSPFWIPITCISDHLKVSLRRVIFALISSSPLFPSSVPNYFNSIQSILDILMLGVQVYSSFLDLRFCLLKISSISLSVIFYMSDDMLEVFSTFLTVQNIVRIFFNSLSGNSMCHFCFVNVFSFFNLY